MVIDRLMSPPSRRSTRVNSRNRSDLGAGDPSNNRQAARLGPRLYAWPPLDSCDFLTEFRQAITAALGVGAWLRRGVASDEARPRHANHGWRCRWHRGKSGREPNAELQAELAWMRPGSRQNGSQSGLAATRISIQPQAMWLGRDLDLDKTARKVAFNAIWISTKRRARALPGVPDLEAPIRLGVSRFSRSRGNDLPCRLLVI